MTGAPEPLKRLRIALVGWGAIARRAAGLLAVRSDRIHIVGIATRRSPGRDGLLPESASWMESPSELRELSPDLVVEAASREAVEQWGIAALRHSSAFIVTSTSALASHDLLERLVGEAKRYGSQILIPPGALGGVDALAAASRLALRSVIHRIIKPPGAWRGTLAESLIDLDGLCRAETFFRGTAREAAQRFPANANVAAISALAGVGFDDTVVELVADPNTKHNSHHLTVEGDFGVLNVRVENRPFAENPKSSELTALSLVRLIEGRLTPLSL